MVEQFYFLDYTFRFFGSVALIMFVAKFYFYN